MKNRWIMLVAALMLGTAVQAAVVTNVVNQTAAVGGASSVSFSLTGAGGNDFFSFEIGITGPYPVWEVGLTTGGDGGLNASQIAMINGYHALLASDTDIASQSTWVGGNLANGSTFFSAFGSDPNGWKNSTGYVGLRYAHFEDGVGVVYNYGWAEFVFEETPDPEVRSFTLTQYAYETEANTTITTPIPEPASALMILLGGSLLALGRHFYGRG